MPATKSHKTKPAASPASAYTRGAVALLVTTRKGAFILKSDAARRSWTTTGPMFFGHTVHHMVLDPRDGKTLLAAARTGHLGPTIFRSADFGKTWKEAAKPPAFPKAAAGKSGRVVDHTFWLTPGHASEPGAWYAGTSPQGLFRSDDKGDTWAPVAGFNDHPMRAKWCGDGQDGTPDGPKMHSINIDPRDPRHLYIAMSSGGVFESTDKGANWHPLNAGCYVDFGPEPYPEYGQDPHCLRLHPLAPDVLYQQNHCGIYRMDRGIGTWERIGTRMPKKIGDIGFPLVLHPRDPATLWVFPMDGTSVWPRTSPGGKPAAYVTRNSGRTWQRLDEGLPQTQGWFTVKRQAMAGDTRDPVGLYFGTTGGEVWASRNEGAKWTCIARYLPHIYAIETVALNR
jgi:hypothetical protein